MIVHALPRRKRMRQQPPGIATARDVADGVQHQPQIVLARAPAAGSRGQDRPLRLAQVGVVTESCHAFQLVSARFSRHSLHGGADRLYAATDGTPVAEVIRKMGITESTFCR